MLTMGREEAVRLLTAFAVGAVLVGTVACGESTSSRAPTAPSSTAPSVTGLTIAGPDAVRTGFASGYTVSVSLSDGSSKLSASASCTSSDPSVASIEAPCRLTGNKHGSATLTVSSQGRTTSKTVNVVNNYGGSWEGDYQVATCDDAGILSGWCAVYDMDGHLADGGGSFSLILTQSGSGQDQISGTISLRNINGNERATVSGNVTNDGRLLLSGSNIISTDSGVRFQFIIGGWSTIVEANTRLGVALAQMSGGWDFSLVAIGANGHTFERQIIGYAGQLTSEPPAVNSPKAHAVRSADSEREHKTVHENVNEF
jgi:hypothetical protein